MNFQRWLYEAENILLENSESPRCDAEILLEFVTRKSRSFLFAFSETLLTKEQENHLFTLLNRLKIGEPIAYLIGEREFWSLPLYVSKATLIPRPETECLVERALILLSDTPVRILDLGTGTGAIALALANERPDCNVVGVDLVHDAVILAYRNAVRLAIKNVTFLNSYWFNSLFDQKFEMIVSNPPYIDLTDFYSLKKNIYFEPLTALISPNKGIADLKYIILHSRKYLVSGGWLLVEHGWSQGNSVRNLFIQAGFQNVKTHHDYSNNERLTIGRIEY